MSWTAQMKVLLFSCLLGGACAFGANPELASEGAVAQGFGTPGAPSEGDGRETRLVKGGGCPDSAPPKFDPLFPSASGLLVEVLLCLLLTWSDSLTNETPHQARFAGVR